MEGLTRNIQEQQESMCCGWVAVAGREERGNYDTECVLHNSSRQQKVQNVIFFNAVL